MGTGITPAELSDGMLEWLGRLSGSLPVVLSKLGHHPRLLSPWEAPVDDNYPWAFYSRIARHVVSTREERARVEVWPRFRSERCDAVLINEQYPNGALYPSEEAAQAAADQHLASHGFALVGGVYKFGEGKLIEPNTSREAVDRWFAAREHVHE